VPTQTHMWIPLSSSGAIADLLTEFGAFHDACLREVALATETYVDERRTMACPGHMDTSALLYFQRQSEDFPAIELRCTGVTQFRLRPTPDNCDSIIVDGTVTTDGEWLRLAVCFVGPPLRGPPNTFVEMPRRSLEDPDLEVIAQSMAWRSLDDALGDKLRYGR
jgi:hypothetical protein